MEKNESKLGKLAEESIKRKERLRTLRERANSNKLRPVFRSYKPLNENTTGVVLEQEPSGDIEEVVQDQLDLLKQPVEIEDIDISNLAPRKLDWDLKRDVAKKLERLERRTQKAIAELILERLKSNEGNQNLFEVVSVAGEQNDNNNEDD